ncbi:uncharacterized protein LOC110188994 [Drosophila serrata]|uniref:uncharacterized protein LOC110188994 n=1 Tax=Drosophila serrata TaxID=7274 RepID=UPI000A1D03CF|nr:uncharacterized protein LOC110188994 [Drosophila serrata]
MGSHDALRPRSSPVPLAMTSGISYVQCQNLKYNVIIMGWLSVIFSSVFLFSSVLTMHLQPDIELLFAQWPFNLVPVSEQQLTIKLLDIFSSLAYGLSLINMGASMLLLIGIARDSSGLMYPWLICHGVSFGFALYLGVFYVTAGLFIDLSTFLMCLLVFTLVLVIYYKIYHEVFTLFRVMEQQLKDRALGGVGGSVFYQDAEGAWPAAGIPYQQLYLPRLPLKQ